MKTLYILGLLLSKLAFGAYDDPSDVGTPEIRYISWCENNRVMSESSDGGIILRADCNVNGSRCVELERIIGASRAIIASCK